MPVLSTEDQNLDLQIDHLTKDGYSKILTEKLTGRNNARPALDKVLKLLRPGDMLVVWKLDCLGRSLKDLINILQVLETRKIGFRSITDGIDTETATGWLLFHVIGVIAEYECVQISERTKAGLQAARRRGKRLGRPLAIKEAQIRLAQQLSATGILSTAEIAARLNVGRATLWRAMKREREYRDF